MDGKVKLIDLTLEAVGWYPKVTGDLRLLDTCGIVAAIISEYYALPHC